MSSTSGDTNDHSTIRRGLSAGNVHGTRLLFPDAEKAGWTYDAISVCGSELVPAYRNSCPFLIHDSDGDADELAANTSELTSVVVPALASTG